MTSQVSHSNVSRSSQSFKIDDDGWLCRVNRCPSPHFDQREYSNNESVDLLVIHNISLPAGKFGGPYINDLFLGQLNPEADATFEEIYQLRVSAHCFIRRDGEIIQYVSFNNRAWHAGVSSYKGREKCNDFSIGIELEGTDDIPYTAEQYQQLSKVSAALLTKYPLISDNIVGHSDIAPGRKTDPGAAFDWHYYRSLLSGIISKDRTP